ncbi:MAG: HAMP domain-containing protein, partial [Candidatus Aureabacteria bacterium]|nr:HAMP domain-containing protein [Candidatus Auribacterota bacterium]
MKNRSIKYKLIRLFLIMGITPSLLIMSIMYFGVSDNLEKQTGHNLQILATETSLRVGLFLQNKIQNVLKYSAYSTLKRLFFPGSNESMASEFIRSLFKFDEDLNNICLIDNNRNLLFSYRPNFGTLNKIDLWWEQALRLHHREILFFSSPPSPSSSEKMKLEIITPIMSDLNDKQLGFMATNIDLSSLVKMIQTIPISGEYYISLIDQNGNLISCTYEKKHRFIPEVLLKFLFENSKGWLQGFDPLMKAYAVFGFDEVSEYKGHALRGQIWKVYVSRKKEEAFEPIFWLLVKLLAIGMGVILLILIIFMFRIEAIWKPIFALKKGAEMIGAGNLDMVLFIQTGDELEDLAQTFNSMG